VLAEAAPDLPQEVGATLVTTVVLFPALASLAVAAFLHSLPLLPSLAGRA
jgi:hypothetical protein